MTLDRPGEKPMHLRAWPEVLKKERRHAQYMAELLGKEVAPEKQLEEMRRKMREEAKEPRHKVPVDAHGREKRPAKSTSGIRVQRALRPPGGGESSILDLACPCSRNSRAAPGT